MSITLAVQVALPLVLIAWLAWAPARSLFGYLSQAVATVLVLLALKLVALWMLLPWWLPLVYLALWLLAIAVTAMRRRHAFMPRWPTSSGSWLMGVVWMLTGAAAAQLAWQGVLAREPPASDVVNIPLPLGPGRYLVANGGSRYIVNVHMKTLDTSVARFRPYRGQSYGVDLIAIDRLGLHADGLQPVSPEAYRIYGEPVHAPCRGTVIASRNDRPDMPVPKMDRDVMEGNHVLLDCGDFELLLAHFRRGSVNLTAGDRVDVGERIGTVGNSGNSSEPHLHISAQRRGSVGHPFSGQPLALTIDGRFPVRNDRIVSSGQTLRAPDRL